MSMLTKQQNVTSISLHFLIPSTIISWWLTMFSTKISSRYKKHLRLTCKNNFLYQLDFIDFSKVDTALQTINHWVGEKTAKKTKDLVVPDIVNPKTRVTLLNTMHFQDKWAKPFTETASGTFTTNDGEAIAVEMMKIKSEFYYKQNTFMNIKILQLPYVNDDIKCFIVLPLGKSQSDLSYVFNNFNLADFADGMTLTEVDVTLPKFKIQEDIDLKEHIKNIGLESVFSADLLGIINEEINFHGLRQQILLDVNQEGLEMASGMVSSLNKAEERKVVPKNGLAIYEMNIKTDISNRFAKTKVVWKVKNVEKSAKDATFKVVLTETAFITGFVMEIEGKSYKSYIKQKEEAKQIYSEALAQGQSAGLVEAKTRDSKEFSVSVNLEPDSVVVFNLTYEEMLQRVHDQYELVLNICPGQIIDHLNIEVDIMETRPIKFVKTPPLRSGKDRIKTEYEKYLEPTSDIQTINAKTASIKYRPEPKTQATMAHYLGEEPSNGLSGQFIVQYDVERDPQDGQILLQDGYFVHFFAPNDLDPLPKHVLFVLDTSGSMGGRKIVQLREAMHSILNEMRKNDIINVVEFSSEVILWDIDSEVSTTIPVFYGEEEFQDPFNNLRKLRLPDPTYVTDGTLQKARNVVNKLEAFGSTYIIGGLETALYLAKIGQDKVSEGDKKCQPIIVFLTDGEPNVGINSTEKITDIVTRLNTKYNKVPIFSLSFGQGADKNFLRKLSLKNQGFSRHIYEAADASLQLQEFYKQISSPLLANIVFKYDSEVEEVTRTHFPIYFRGSELVVTGRYRESSLPTTINCWGPRGPIVIPSIIESSVTSLERLWAYLTVKQLLDERDTVEDKTELTKKATNLALKYSFVTDVTSLVVVKPKETNTLEDTTRRPEPGSGFAAAPPYAVYDHSAVAPPKRKARCCMRRASPLSANIGATSFGSAPSAIQQSTGHIFGSSMTPRSTFAAPGGSTGLFGNLATDTNTSFGGQQVFGGGSRNANMNASGATSFCYAPSALPQSTGHIFGSSMTQQSTFAAPGGSTGLFGNLATDTSTSFGGQQLFGGGSRNANVNASGTLSFGDKKSEEFLVDHPFIVILQIKKEDKMLILFKGCILKPSH
ncbi:hypothetical protein NQ318_017084 [Aromia moschata]|uniref:Uncharacterized protein n=1 Tax=Aromia moschata TaxID=1265417 RepID=A0AAV8XKZ7_9CUCU|nr:hypothetical protein NQ318_017084 [Aromia moschata]